jgi:hypothetical protein
LKLFAFFFTETADLIDARTSRVLVALVASMTIGAVVLMSLESGTTNRENRELAGIRAGVRDTILPEKNNSGWSRIVIHSSTDTNLLPSRCHFIVSPKPYPDGMRVRATRHWKNQDRTGHIHVTGHDYADSIGICLIGDYSRRSPETQQFEALVVLVQELQRTCRVDADNVYLRSDLDPGSSLPGRAFPVNLFNSRLIRLGK